MKFRPMAAGGWSWRFNLDGFINVRGDENSPGYTQVFRHGILEATHAGIVYESHGMTFLRAGTSDIVAVLPSYFEGLRTLDVPAPIIVMISYEGVAGAWLGSPLDFHRDEIEPFPPVDPLLLPEVIVEDYGSPEDYARQLRPVFDALWNAAGFARCTYYDEDGNWRPPR